jgi:hypothetical protein
MFRKVAFSFVSGKDGVQLTETWGGNNEFNIAVFFAQDKD